MTDDRVHIVDTGVANIASMKAAFRRLGAEPTLTRDAQSIESGDRVVLPGVGAFGAGMEMLREADLAEPLRRRLAEPRPTLAVCLGMQLLADGSEESPGVDGLGVIEARVGRFGEDVRVPQFGWNEVEPTSDCEMLRPGYAYFANSYRLATPPPGWACALTEYGGDFVSAMERGPVLACQFHPEISSSWGLNLLERWLEQGNARC